MDILRVQSSTLADIRSSALDFDVELSEPERVLVAEAVRQQREYDAVDMELEGNLIDLLNVVERRGKAGIDIRQLNDTINRHRDTIRAWLVDPCYDLHESDTFSPVEKRALRALQRVALDSGSTNIQQALYVVRLEQRLAKVELSLENVLRHMPTDAVTAARVDRPKG